MKKKKQKPLIKKRKAKAGGDKKERPWNVRAYCIALLRRGFLRSAIRQQCLVKYRVKRKNPANGNEIYYIPCAICKELFKQGEIKVDHIEPVTPVDKQLISLDEFAKRLYCDVSKLQILCKGCHDAKSKAENEKRKEAKKKAKEKN